MDCSEHRMLTIHDLYHTLRLVLIFYQLHPFILLNQVHIFDQDTPWELINSLRPDIVVKGGDYKKEDVVGNDLADVIIFDFVEGRSTTLTLEKIRSKQ